MSAQIIKFRRSRTKPEPTYLLATVPIQEVEHEELEPGDLVAISFPSTPEMVIFTRWLGRSGRDKHGRFIAEGSRAEAFYFDLGLFYDELERGSVRIVGKLLDGQLSSRPRTSPAA